VAEAYVNNNNNSSSPTTTIIIIASKQTTHTNIAHIYVKGGKERERVAKQQRQQKSLQPRKKNKKSSTKKRQSLSNNNRRRISLPAHLAVVVCPTLHASSTLHHTRTPCTRNRTPHTQTYYLNTLAVILLISFVFQRQLRLAAMIVSQGLG
jgi:hypothetical protein